MVHSHVKTKLHIYIYIHIYKNIIMLISVDNGIVGYHIPVLYK